MRIRSYFFILSLYSHFVFIGIVFLSNAFFQSKRLPHGEPLKKSANRSSVKNVFSLILMLTKRILKVFSAMALGLWYKATPGARVNVIKKIVGTILTDIFE